MVNGALIQLMMASRVMYGLAGQGALPGWLGQVHSRTRTPLHATLLVGLAILILALWFRLGGLAQTTSLITSGIFALVNLSLLRIKLRAGAADEGVIFRIPVWVPFGGFLVSSSFLLASLWQFTF
jgi:amino acid transporter